MTAQNLGQPFPVGPTASLLVATCVDSRVRLKLPPGAAFELRSAGVNLSEREFFQIAMIVARVGIRHIALISHEDCAMIGLSSRRELITQGIAQLDGWDEAQAGEYFSRNAPTWQQDDPIGHSARLARELGERFAPIQVARLHYSEPEGTLYQVVEPAAG